MYLRSIMAGNACGHLFVLYPVAMQAQYCVKLGSHGNQYAHVQGTVEGTQPCPMQL